MNLKIILQKHLGIILASFFMYFSAMESHADINIIPESETLEISPGTVVDSFKVKFDIDAVEFQLRHRGNTNNLKKQCEEFTDFRVNSNLSDSVVKDFEPQRPYPELVAIFRPISPGWSKRWQEAFKDLENSEKFKLSAVSNDWRPDIVNINLSIVHANISDDAFSGELELFANKLNTEMYINRSKFRDVGSFTIKIDRLLIACALADGFAQFKIEYALKGANIINVIRALNEDVDEELVEAIEVQLLQDNIPRGRIDELLNIHILARMIETIPTKELGLTVENIVNLNTFSKEWSNIIDGRFRELTRKELDRLIQTLISEDIVSMYLQHTNTVELEIIEE